MASTRISPGKFPNAPTLESIEEQKSDKQKCEEKGGFWDEATQTCILGNKKNTETSNNIPLPKIKPNVPEVGKTINDSTETITLPDGRQFFGLKKSDVSEMVRGYEADKLPLGAAPAGTAQAKAKEQARLQQLGETIGQVGQLTDATQADINFGQAMTAGAARVLPGLAGGAATGALVGGVPTTGIGALPGAAIGAGAGAITGFISGIMANIKEQQAGELQAADIELTNARTNMRQLAMLASQDPANADIYISQYNQQLTRLYQARRQTKAEVTGNLNSFMEDGREQLADFDAFIKSGGTADIYGQKLKVALNSGVSLTINSEGDLV